MARRLGRRLAAGVIAALLLATAVPALAQARRLPSRPAPRRPAHGPGRVVVDLSGGVQGAGPAIADQLTFEANVEQAVVDLKYSAAGSRLVTGGLGILVWKHLGIGAAVSGATRTGSVAIDGRIPHPLFFEKPRAFTATASGMTRAETAVHLQVLYAVPASRRVTLTLSGGPSFISVQQDLVREVRFGESYPFDSVLYQGVDRARAKATAPGFNAGADLRWMFARRLGAGALVRYVRSNVDLPSPAGTTLHVQTGGVQAGGGIRIVF